MLHGIFTSLIIDKLLLRDIDDSLSRIMAIDVDLLAMRIKLGDKNFEMLMAMRAELRGMFL
jgi:hypothetical protein